MKIGILADIHEAVAALEAALHWLVSQKVDRIVVLGDICDHGQRVSETTAILRRVGAVGVWGNHDLGLCLEPSPAMRQRYGGEVLDYFATLRGHYVEEDCLFSHVQTWMDPADLEQPWYVVGKPDNSELLARNFAATEARVQFQGHYHCWMAATPAGLLPWSGIEPLLLEPKERYLFLVNAVCSGWCATYDTHAGLLTPHADTATVF